MEGVHTDDGYDCDYPVHTMRHVLTPAEQFSECLCEQFSECLCEQFSECLCGHPPYCKLALSGDARYLLRRFLGGGVQWVFQYSALSICIALSAFDIVNPLIKLSYVAVMVVHHLGVLLPHVVNHYRPGGVHVVNCVIFGGFQVVNSDIFGGFQLV